MKIWLDDQWDDPEMPARHPPDGWVGFKSPIQVCRQIREGKVREISFDHDLGLPFTGYTVARMVEKLAFLRRISPIRWSIHSANPVGAQNIERAMQAAERFWNKS